MNKRLLVVLLYQLFVLLYAFYSGAPFSKSLTGTSYTWFCIVFLVLLNFNNASSFKSDAFVRLGWWILGAGVVLLCLIASNGLQQFKYILYLPQGSDRLTLSVTAFGFLVFYLCYKPVNRIEKVAGIIFVISSIIDIYLCSRKGMLISYIVVLGMHGLKSVKRMNANRCLKVIAETALLLIIGVVVVESFPSVSKAVASFGTLIKNSILGYLGKADGLYNTGAYRNANATALMNELVHEYSFCEILLGKGYAYRNIDFPYLEAFADFGLIGGFFFLYVALYIPLKLILVKHSDSAVRFAQYYAIVAIFQNVYSGLPFGHYKFVPIIFLIWIMNKSGREYRHEKYKNKIFGNGWKV